MLPSKTASAYLLKLFPCDLQGGYAFLVAKLQDLNQLCLWRFPHHLPAVVILLPFQLAAAADLCHVQTCTPQSHALKLLEHSEVMMTDGCKSTLLCLEATLRICISNWAAIHALHSPRMVAWWSDSHACNCNVLCLKLLQFISER